MTGRQPKMRHLSITVAQQGPNDPRPHWGLSHFPGCTVVKLGPWFVNVSTWRHQQAQSLRTATLSRFRVTVARWDSGLERARRSGEPR